MWVVIADRNKSHKAGYVQARWYFGNKKDAIKYYSKVLTSDDNYGATMYRNVKMSKLVSGTKEIIR